MAVEINMRKGAAIRSPPLGNVGQSKLFKQKKGVVLHVHSSSINNSQDKETVYVSIYRGMKKENVKWSCIYVYLLVWILVLCVCFCLLDKFIVTFFFF